MRIKKRRARAADLMDSAKAMLGEAGPDADERVIATLRESIATNWRTLRKHDRSLGRLARTGKGLAYCVNKVDKERKLAEAGLIASIVGTFVLDRVDGEVDTTGPFGFLKSGDRLTVSKDGRLELSIPIAGIKLNIAGLSSVIAEAITGEEVRFELLKGQIRVVGEKVMRGIGGSRFQIKGAGATVAVHGTEFLMREAEGSVEITVLHGIVDVTPHGAPASIEVTAGQRITVTASGHSSAPEAFDADTLSRWWEEDPDDNQS